MIATGFPFDNGINTEIVDVEDSNFNCTYTEEFPIELADATGGLMSGQTPFICRGDCYQLTEAGSWAKDQRARLTTVRRNAGYGTVVLNNNLVITGEHNGAISLNSMFIEMVSPNTTSQTLSVQIPSEFSLYCQVPWDSETFLVTGGFGGAGVLSNERRETYFINVIANQITSGPSLNIGRYAHACGELEANGTSYIIVSGGYNDDRLRSTEVLDKNNVGQGWQKGKNSKVPQYLYA